MESRGGLAGSSDGKKRTAYCGNSTMWVGGLDCWARQADATARTTDKKASDGVRKEDEHITKSCQEDQGHRRGWGGELSNEEKLSTRQIVIGTAVAALAAQLDGQVPEDPDHEGNRQTQRYRKKKLEIRSVRHGISLERLPPCEVRWSGARERREALQIQEKPASVRVEQ